MNKKFTQDIIQHFHCLHKAPQFQNKTPQCQNIDEPGLNDVVLKISIPKQDNSTKRNLFQLYNIMLK